MLMRGLGKYWVLAAKGFIQNLQYSASHLINAAASAVFGVVYIYLWKSVTPPAGFGEYTPVMMVHYVVLNQTTMWFTQFGVRVHVRIRDAVRSGNVASELMRPIDFFTYRVVTEYGSMLYGLVFRGIPVGLMLSIFGFRMPESAGVWGWTLAALAVGAYIAIVDLYLVGLTSFWTTEIRTASWVVTTLHYMFGGASMPLEVFPAAVYKIARWSPFACLTYNPARIFLELILPGVAWAVILTLAAQALTTAARRKLEVQGG